MNTYSFTADNVLVQQIKAAYPHPCVEKQGYIDYQVKPDNCTITIYTSGKIVLQGNDADYYYQTLQNKKTSCFIEQAGSDEVGTGDFFGPICVCASYIDEERAKLLNQMKFDDSKKLNDDYICKAVEQIIDKIPHSLLVLDNVTYNRVISSNNMNAIKAKLHNKAYVNLIEKQHITLPQLVVIDDFCGKDKYYQYIQNEPKIVEGITFQTKAESAYLSVAVSSMIARYAFLKAMDSLSQQYRLEFAKGAGAPADEFARHFVERYGKDELVKVAKLNFKNVQKL